MSAFLQFVMSEWYFAAPMFLLSFVAFLLIIWRLLLNREAATPLNEFLPAFQERLAEQGTEGALAFCRSQPGLIAQRLFVKGLETAREGRAAMRRVMAESVELEILPELHFLLAPILAIAKIATMIGLLGTVISMIHTFSEISDSVEAGAGIQAGAIGLALFATALGLSTAIPLVFAHVLFKAWVARFEIQLKSAASKLLVLMDSTRSIRPPTIIADAGATAPPVRPTIRLAARATLPPSPPTDPLPQRDAT